MMGLSGLSAGVFAVKVYETISEIAGHLRHCQVPNLDTWPHTYLERYTHLIVKAATEGTLMSLG